MPSRATKIVATLGPASSEPALLEAMIQAGVNVVRLNFSHGKAQDHIDRARLVREAATRAGREVAIMADLQGPKIRVGKFAEGKVMLENGAKFVLDASRTEPGDLQGVGLDYKELPRDVKPGDLLLLNDGLIVLTVEAVRGEQAAGGAEFLDGALLVRLEFGLQFAHAVKSTPAKGKGEGPGHAPRALAGLHGATVTNAGPPTFRGAPCFAAWAAQ